MHRNKIHILVLVDETVFEYMAGVVRDMADGGHMADARYFDGSQMEVHVHIAMSVANMHEHLGKLIAYARTNHVVPSWSKGN